MPTEPLPSNSVEDTLSAALARHEIELPQDQIELLSRYARLLWEWNQKLNLTRHTDFEKFVARDVLDSLAFSRFLASGEDVLDVGTGGGVPGIILAATRPDISISLVDSVAKKVRAVEQIVADLGLPVPVHRARVQDLLEYDTYDTLVVRAVAPLEKLLTWLEPRWGTFWRLLVLTGPAWIEQRRKARERGLMRELELRKLDAYPLPGTQSESVLLQIKLKAES